MDTTPSDSEKGDPRCVFGILSARWGCLQCSLSLLVQLPKASPSSHPNELSAYTKCPHAQFAERPHVGQEAMINL